MTEEVAPIMIILCFLAGAGAAKMLIARMNIPFIEIYMKKGPIGWFFYGNDMIPFDLGRSRNGYVVMNNNKIRGIFKVTDNPKYVRYIGKTQCLFYSPKNINPMDIELANELNQFMLKGKMSKLKRKDLNHSRLLNGFLSRMKKEDAEKKVKEIVDNSGLMLDTMIDEAKVKLSEELDEYNKQQEVPRKLDPTEESLFILKYLKSKGIINEADHATFIYKVENGKLNFGQMIDELRNMSVISITEPLDPRVESWLEDFAAEDPINLSGHVDDLRTGKKGLHSLTPVPVKSFIPAGIILAVGLVALFFVILVSNGTIPLDPSKWGAATGGTGFHLPFTP